MWISCKMYLVNIREIIELRLSKIQANFSKVVSDTRNYYTHYVKDMQFQKQ